MYQNMLGVVFELKSKEIVHVVPMDKSHSLYDVVENYNTHLHKMCGWPKNATVEDEFDVNAPFIIFHLSSNSEIQYCAMYVNISSAFEMFNLMFDAYRLKVERK